MTGVLLSIVGCGMLAGVDDKGNPTGKGVLDRAAEVVKATAPIGESMAGPIYGIIAGLTTAGLGLAGVKLRSYLIKKAGRKDDNGNGVPDDTEAKG